LALAFAAAQLAIGRLDGAARVIPNPKLFVSMYVRQEAVLSAQIEGTQASLSDVLEYELEGKTDRLENVEEIVNYVQAMELGLHSDLPLSLRLIRDVHRRLLQGVRGQDKAPGEFRRTLVWLGGRTPQEAIFVPPTPDLVPACLSEFETFLHNETLAPLVHSGLMHAQFETIHPFTDGNGRMGRLLVTLLLCQRKVLGEPLLYLSSYLKAHRQEYYRRLQAIREDGDWEGWLRFFFDGVAEVAHAANETAQKILAMRNELGQTLAAHGRAGANLIRALDQIFRQPIIDARALAEALSVTRMTALNLIDRLVALGVISETTGRQRSRRFLFERYLKLFDSKSRGTETETTSQASPAEAPATVVRTQGT
jgi:Fic family protein